MDGQGKRVRETIEERRAREKEERRLARVASIRQLLDFWDDIWDPSAGLSDRGGDGTGTAMMPRWTHDRAVQELLRALRHLRETDRHTYAPLAMFYGADTRITIEQVRVRVRKGCYKLEPTPRRARVLPRGFDTDRVTFAIDRLEELYRGAPELPKDLLCSLNEGIAQTSQSTWLAV